MVFTQLSWPEPGPPSGGPFSTNQVQFYVTVKGLLRAREGNLKSARDLEEAGDLKAGMGQQFSWEEAEASGEMDVAELQEWYKKFVVECPSGTLFMHEFKRFFKVTGNEEATQYVEGMFRAFDKNGVRSPAGEDV